VSGLASQGAGPHAGRHRAGVATRRVSELRALEAEAVGVVREVAAELSRPVLMFSGGKDSIALLRLAEKAFRPLPLPFPVLHVDTGHNFPEVIEFRDRRIREGGHRLIVASVQDSIDAGRVKEEARGASRNRLQTTTLLDAIEEHGFDAAFGGARRDEERARAKERVLSFRDEFGQWEPRAQRPEPWTLYNSRIRPGEHIRVFPLSNWTELDVWRYIEAERLELPSIYFSHRRRVIERDGMLLAESEWVRPESDERAEEAAVRYRTVGDLTVTGAVRSEARDIPSVMREIAEATVSERGQTRADDRVSAAAMEDRKREGYF
jgi:sulfate adenylyltransferase subunit 2